MHDDGWGGAHVRLADVLHDDRNPPLPDVNLLVIGRCDESSIIVREGDGIHAAQMSIVFLHELPGPDIPLENLLV